MRLLLPIIMLATSVFADEATIKLPEVGDPLYNQIIDTISELDLKTVDASRSITNAYAKLGITIEIDDPRENNGYFQALSLSLQLTPENLKVKAGSIPGLHCETREDVFLFFFNNSNCQKIDFDKDSWSKLNGNSRNRYRMMKSFTEKHHPKDKEKSFLLDYLGRPTFENNDSISYSLGTAWHPMDDTFITFIVDSGIIRDFKIHINMPNQGMDLTR